MRWLSVALVLACTPTETQPVPDPEPKPAPEQAAPTPDPEPTPESPPEVPAGCDARAVEAARTAIATAIANGVDGSMLADCDPEQVVCATERRPLEPTQSCQLLAHHEAERWAILIVPRPATGAPTQLEIWVDESGKEAGRVNISGSTFGVIEGVTIEGHGEYASHTHGGAPARIGGASFVVINRRDQAVELKITGTRWLVAHSCELPRDERARPKPAGLAFDDGLIDGTMTLKIPAGATKTVRIGHQVQDAYMAWCDRFATAAQFELAGQALEVIAEHHVVRREPLRRP
jgi:hypothetical protein